MGFKPMLAKTAEPGSLSFPLIVQPKLDGIRAAVVDGRLVSRTLKPIPNAEIRAALERPELEGLDGELIVGPSTAEDCYRRTCSFVMAESKRGEPWAFHVFDKWDNPNGFTTRLYDAASKVAGGRYPSLALVPAVTVRDEPELEAEEARLLAEGHEGAILRDPDGPYKFGRSGKRGPLLKLKRYVDFEAKVIGAYEEQHNANAATRNALGRTERSTAKAGKVGKGTLGGLTVVAINGPAQGVTFNVGTGFDADQRRELWAERLELEGRTVKIKSFPIGVKEKPRHPVWLGWRDMEVDG